MVDGNGLLGVTPSPDKASRTTCLFHDHGRATRRQGTLSCLRVRSGLWRRVRHFPLAAWSPLRPAQRLGGSATGGGVLSTATEWQGAGVQPVGHPPSTALWPSTLPVPNAGAPEFGIMIMTSTSVLIRPRHPRQRHWHGALGRRPVREGDAVIPRARLARPIEPARAARARS
jgi:hypothetical protein